MKQAVTLTVHYTDGSTSVFSFEALRRSNDVANLLDNLVTSKMLSLQTETGLLVIPLASIKSLNVVPGPAVMPPSAIRGVSILE